MALNPGTRLGPYEILSAIGAGGMGEVYKARDTRLNRIVAIKISKEGLSDRFEREARAVAALNQPHVCQLYDVGPDYLVMEFVEGAPMRSGDTPQRLITLALQITDSLAAARAAGIVHRDLKPGNVMLTRGLSRAALVRRTERARADEITGTRQSCPDLRIESHSSR